MIRKATLAQIIAVFAVIGSEHSTHADVTPDELLCGTFTNAKYEENKFLPDFRLTTKTQSWMSGENHIYFGKFVNPSIDNPDYPVQLVVSSATFQHHTGRNETCISVGMALGFDNNFAPKGIEIAYVVGQVCCQHNDDKEHCAVGGPHYALLSSHISHHNHSHVWMKSLRFRISRSLGTTVCDQLKDEPPYDSVSYTHDDFALSFQDGIHLGADLYFPRPTTPVSLHPAESTYNSHGVCDAVLVNSYSELNIPYACVCIYNGFDPTIYRQTVNFGFACVTASYETEHDDLAAWAFGGTARFTYNISNNFFGETSNVSVVETSRRPSPNSRIVRTSTVIRRLPEVQMRERTFLEGSTPTPQLTPNGATPISQQKQKEEDIVHGVQELKKEEKIEVASADEVEEQKKKIPEDANSRTPEETIQRQENEPQNINDKADDAKRNTLD